MAQSTTSTAALPLQTCDPFTTFCPGLSCAQPATSGRVLTLSPNRDQFFYSNEPINVSWSYVGKINNTKSYLDLPIMIFNDGRFTQHKVPSRINWDLLPAATAIHRIYVLGKYISFCYRMDRHNCEIKVN